MTVNASDILDVQIGLASLKGMREDEVEGVVLSHWLIQQARDDFLNGRLTWSEYLDLVESHQVNMDSYLDTVEENLTIVGAL